MPVYTYRCENCGVQFDQKQGYDDPTLTICPECEEEALHRVYRPVGIVFKGSGFYATDNRSPSGQKTRKEDESAKNKKNETSEKSETKEASKTTSGETKSTESTTAKDSKSGKAKETKK